MPTPKTDAPPHYGADVATSRSAILAIPYIARSTDGISAKASRAHTAATWEELSRLNVFRDSDMSILIELFEP